VPGASLPVRRDAGNAAVHGQLAAIAECRARSAGAAWLDQDRAMILIPNRTARLPWSIQRYFASLAAKV